MSTSAVPPRAASRVPRTLLALLLCLPAGAHVQTARAQTATPSVAVHGAAPVCRQPHYIKPSELSGIAGTYDLSNGDVLYVSRESRQFFAEMGRIGRMEIIPMNENEFAERGGPLRFRFDRDHPFTDVTVAGLDAQRPGMSRCPPG